MFDAQILNQGDAVYSSWIPRAGDNLRATIDVIKLTATNIKVEVYHKNRDETGDGTPVTGDITRTTAGVETEEWTACKELVRFKFTVTGSGSQYAIFRMLANVWYDTCKA